ncbi:hypothetical protein CRU98_00815 [Arcobacter sp. CECT 8986]|uniref:cache domain-containing protein n=1 Tax=Arcobacter sp. CECT 8986 TaxID=2044507 RepID=UPI001009F6A8|nr:cache domain-containing protein [Arcobacter sp. CECT 8986]RXK01026.1 hypothetical protein CRU98_00815 [Arcobacter sp. CECT 8986]
MTKQLSKVIFYLILIVSLFSIIIMKIFDFSYEYKLYKENEHSVREEYLEKQKSNLKIEIDKAISLIEYNYDKKEEFLNKSLKQRTYEGYNLALNLYNKYKDTKSKKEILQLIESSLSSMKFYDGYGYYFLLDFNGKIIFHGANSKYNNSYKLKNYKDNNGKIILNEILNVATNKKEGFVSWGFISPISNKEEDKKGYVKVLEPFNMVLVSADYMSRMEEELKKEAIDRIRNLSTFENGYVFLLNYDGTILANRYRLDSEGKSYTKLDSIYEKSILKSILKSIKNKDEEFLTYKWHRQDSKEKIEKLTYIKKFEKWHWIIGTGVYLDKMEALIKKQKELLETKALYKLGYSLLVFFILFAFIVILTKKIFKDLDSSFLLFVDFFKNANTNNETINTDKINFLEFKELANQANKMIQTKIQNEKELENKNKEVLINLSLLNEYKKAVDVSAIVSKTDSKGIITFANEKFCKISGYSRKELLGAKHNLVKHPDTKKEVYKDLWKTILDKRVWKGVLKNRAKDGSAYYVKSTIVPILDVDGAISEFIAIRYDISDLISQEKRIRLQTTDLLTGLSNRQKLLEDLDSCQHLILSVFNIQRFKEINEYYGFEVGDKLLIEVAKLLNSMVHQNYLNLYKLQGDEFAILLTSNDMNLQEFKTLCQKIINDVKKFEFTIDNNKLEVDFIAGISSERNYFINAEMAKNHAKLENKEIIVFDENRGIKNSLIENVTWTKKLKEAIEDDRLVVFAQPIVSNKNNKVEKYECLVRMIDSDGTVISPFHFLHVAKKAKLYNKLTQIMINKSFKYFSDKDAEFSINLTIEDILYRPTVQLLEDNLAKYKAISQRVILEIVEEEGIENYQEISDFIEKMKSLGCKIAIDDFGTGYSNFEYLMKLNVDIVKIDGSMIRYINQDLNAKIVTELIVSFTKKLNIKTVAEYVHSKEIHEIIKDMGIDYSQGFYLGEPEHIE